MTKTAVSNGWEWRVEVAPAGTTPKAMLRWLLPALDREMPNSRTTPCPEPSWRSGGCNTRERVGGAVWDAQVIAFALFVTFTRYGNGNPLVPARRHRMLVGHLLWG